MSSGTPGNVKAQVRHLMATVGRGGGYICAPTHYIEPETPLENTDAFLEAIERHRYYR